jgi:excisionase family DNA binding protein
VGEPLDQVFGAYPQTLTVDQLAELLGIGREMAYRYLQRGAVPGYKIAGSWVIYRDEVKEHLRTERADRIARHRTPTGGAELAGGTAAPDAAAPDHPGPAGTT